VVSTAGPAGIVAVVTDPSVKARSVVSSSGTSCFLTLDTVGGDAASCQLTTTVFSLSVNVTEFGVVVRDHPSGIEIVKPPRLEV
jgi:hypothetical protein